MTLDYPIIALKQANVLMEPMEKLQQQIFALTIALGIIKTNSIKCVQLPALLLTVLFIEPIRYVLKNVLRENMLIQILINAHYVSRHAQPVKVAQSA